MELKPLTNLQYDKAKEKALSRIEKQIGNQPERKNYRKEYGPLYNTLDIIAIIIFLCAWAVSSTHIKELMKNQAEVICPTWADQEVGIALSPHACSLTHEVGYIAMSELAIVLFFVMHTASAYQRKGRKLRIWKMALSLEWMSLFLMLAIISSVFVFGANVASGLDPFISILPPIFTIGIGFRLESIIAEQIRRNREIDERYNVALGVYEKAKADPTTHPKYQQFLAQEIWAALIALKANAAAAEAPKPFKLKAVASEIREKDLWVQEVNEVLGRVVEDADAADQVIEELELQSDPEVFPTPGEAGLWTARSSLSGYLLGTTFTSEKEARKRLKSYDYGWKRRNPNKA